MSIDVRENWLMVFLSISFLIFLSTCFINRKNNIEIADSNFIFVYVSFNQFLLCVIYNPVIGYINIYDCYVHLISCPLYYYKITLFIAAKWYHPKWILYSDCLRSVISYQGILLNVHSTHSSWYPIFHARPVTHLHQPHPSMDGFSLNPYWSFSTLYWAASYTQTLFTSLCLWHPFLGRPLTQILFLHWSAHPGLLCYADTYVYYHI